MEPLTPGQNIEALHQPFFPLSFLFTAVDYWIDRSVDWLQTGNEGTLLSASFIYWRPKFFVALTIPPLLKRCLLSHSGCAIMPFTPFHLFCRRLSKESNVWGRSTHQMSCPQVNGDVMCEKNSFELSPFPSFWLLYLTDTQSSLSSLPTIHILYRMHCTVHRAWSCHSKHPFDLISKNYVYKVSINLTLTT